MPTTWDQYTPPQDRKYDPETPARLDLTLDTPLVKQAKALLGEWARRASYVKQVRAKLDERKREIGEKEATYHALLKENAESGTHPGDREAALLADIKTFGEELRDTWDPQIENALALARDAADAYHTFLDENESGLLLELKPEGDRLSKLYKSEQETFRKRTEKLGQERGLVEHAARQFSHGARWTLGVDAETIQHAPDAPLYTDELLAALQQLQTA